MPLLCNGQRDDTWFDARRGKITASLAAACLGLDPNKSRQAAWREITQDEHQQDNRHMAWGREFEARAREDYEVDTGAFVETTGFWGHPTLPWLGASPDGLLGETGLLEVKCPGVLPERIPIHHRIQVLIQLACTERRFCDYYAWTHNGTFCQRVWPAGTLGLIARLSRFYEEFVRLGFEPPRKKRRKKGAA